jgi:hypothetical protein
MRTHAPTSSSSIMPSRSKAAHPPANVAGQERLDGHQNRLHQPQPGRLPLPPAPAACLAPLARHPAQRQRQQGALPPAPHPAPPPPARSPLTTHPPTHLSRRSWSCTSSAWTGLQLQPGGAGQGHPSWPPGARQHASSRQSAQQFSSIQPSAMHRLRSTDPERRLLTLRLRSNASCAFESAAPAACMPPLRQAPAASAPARRAWQGWPGLDAAAPAPGTGGYELRPRL